jgi:hypothetical protein
MNNNIDNYNINNKDIDEIEYLILHMKHPINRYLSTLCIY